MTLGSIIDLTAPKVLAHLLKFDDTGEIRKADTVEAKESSIMVDGKENHLI